MKAGLRGLMEILRYEGKMAPGMLEETARGLRRDAKLIQRHHLDVCNTEGYDIETGERRVARAFERMQKRVHGTPIRVIEGSNDPRGAGSLLILPSGRSNTWTGNGYGICL